ncbi:1,4-Dihydroxy-2-naphthoyl-CoA synthase [Delftia tsuruhatensis]|uniref:enoyl-CoA hydratase/isomerase family protein n=1 Tax=Delftia tsuruhatensis TaxID=180282 RepID=UPI001E6D9310|nr:enoyl-CoA hydratase/isomerase family protein [Delftia tsuruhatensis]CAB5692787.1 1,4-Dihydroxy-2-naphthoyl-CoA synthase [Delftia tsuruhatensis]CAC9687637.1 1,4-Dihydroxy-2-naphthoyl-CoA synthase [Delftia tsuruhatensis]
MSLTDSVPPELSVRQHEGVLWLTICREERRNAISPGVLQGLSEALARAGRDRSVRAIVLTGAGDKAFCAGADLQSGQSFQFDYSEPTQGLANLLRLARATHVPKIARVNGACMAGGMGLLALCDMAVAAPHARFGLPEVKVGLFPAQVLSVLQDLVGRRMLTELCITGEPIDARQALACGLLNHVDEDLDAGVQALLDRVLDKSPAAVRRGLYLMAQIDSMSFEQSMAFTESQIALFALTEDAAEGQQAFREKRQPRWTGR